MPIIYSSFFGIKHLPATFALAIKENVLNYQKEESVAQLVEHYTFNVGVLGSNPSGITG